MRTSIPQRLVLVLPTSGEFDSRTYRIATGCVARGHEVTVIGRSDDGTTTDVRVPSGYRIIRVPVDPLDVVSGGSLVRRVRRARAAGPRAQGADPAMAGTATGSRSSGPGRRIRAAWRSARRLTAIGLTVRAQTIAARRVDPVGDLYHGMAYMGIPVALDLAGHRHRPVVYDARDIYLEARNLARLPRPARWLVARLERGWAHRATRVVTTNDAYAERLTDSLRVSEPLVVMNCSYRYARAVPRVRRFHERLGLAEERQVVLYHGGLFPERGIEQLIAAMPALPSADLVLMGYGSLEASLPGWIAASPAGDRIHVLPAVPPEELHDWVAAADVAAMPIQPSTVNHRLTTPNKLFEAMAAGVPIVASDLPGMATIVRETGCGVLCDPTDPASIAAAIASILEAPDEIRQGYARAGARAADETYNWEAQLEVLLAEYRRLTGQPW